tara:strand:+ start:211 stop:660 length:450 start_codon:yes stop_codon:yes gene_type:complete
MIITFADNRNINVPEENAQKSDWKTYLAKLRNEFPRDRANELFLITWRFNGTFSYTTDSDFNNYFKKKGILLPSDTAKAIASVKDVGSSLFDIVGMTINIAKYGIPIVGGITLILVLYFLFNVSKKGNVSDLAMLTPQGRALKMGKLLK